MRNKGLQYTKLSIDANIYSQVGHAVAKGDQVLGLIQRSLVYRYSDIINNRCRNDHHKNKQEGLLSPTAQRAACET